MTTTRKIFLTLGVLVFAFFGYGFYVQSTTAPEQLEINACMREVRAAKTESGRYALLDYCESLRQAWRKKLLADSR